MTDIQREITRMRDAGEEGVLVLVTGVDGHAPQVVGARMIVRADGEIRGTIGGGRVEHEVIGRAQSVLENGHPESVSFQLKTELGMCCGGRMEVYMEPVVARERLILFGAGHVGAATARFAAACGFQVVVVDEREAWNTAERLPDVDRRVVAPHVDFLADFELRTGDSVVIVTHNHDHDREVLAATAGTAARYVGMIGSTRKVEKTLRRLRLEGVDAGALDRVKAPIGLDILAETPEEIAVAIVGELIRVRREELSQKKTRGAPIRSLTARHAEETARLEAVGDEGGGG